MSKKPNWNGAYLNERRKIVSRVSEDERKARARLCAEIAELKAECRNRQFAKEANELVKHRVMWSPLGV